MAQYRTMPFSPLNKTGLHYERSGAGEALVLVHGSWVAGRTWDAVRPANDPQVTHPDSYIESLEGFATSVAHG